jgi:pimeloyl-ACP methyl ester carboxylesterase
MPDTSPAQSKKSVPLALAGMAALPASPFPRNDGHEPASTEPAVGAPFDPFGMWAYSIDAWQRSVLLWDVLRKRANIMLEHEEAGMPPVHTFQYEMLLDARRFERPANYALLRITTAGTEHADVCVDKAKPPVIVMDPRAGHGPGIGGFKRDSEIGIVDEVIARHPGKNPVLYGNCQAGWAAMLVAIHCRAPVGPIVLNGSPLSYWARESGATPMRLAGGLLGGSWLTHFVGDLGDGRFDGAWLVQNFETLKPEAAIWDKYASLYLNVDHEEKRFLEFERWWNAWYSFSREEMVEIVDHLFIGNELEQGTLDLGDAVRIDLRSLKSPLVIFASYGDNITPPHQALAWLKAVYKTTDALKEAGQRIVFMTDPRVGHLGIFVSASVARLEHRAILESLDDVVNLPPGLYEMKISNPTNDPDCRKPQYSVSFEARRVEDLAFDNPRKAFERVRQLSQANETLYSNFVSPWVQAMTTPWSAEVLRWLHPMRTSRYMLSEKFCPWMHGIARLADEVRLKRMPVSSDNLMRSAERTLSQQPEAAIEMVRRTRDSAEEQGFRNLYR